MLIASNALSSILKIGDRPIPLLGICLGHQALCLADGSRLEPSPEGPVHGSPSGIEHMGTGLFENSEKICSMMRYNSLAVVSHGRTLVPNAWESGTRLIMGVQHPSLPIHGVQFHPESSGSRGGSKIFYKFLETCINRSVEDKALNGRTEHYANLPHVHPKLPRESVCQRQRAKVPSLRPLRC